MKGPYVLTWVTVDVNRRVVWRESLTDEPIRFRSIAAAQAVFDKLWFSASGSKEMVSDMQIIPLVQWLIEQGR